MIPLLGGSVTSASRFLGHWSAFGVNLIVFAFSMVFVYRQSVRRARQPTHWLRYGPTYLTIVAALLIMADNTRHVLQDTKASLMGLHANTAAHKEPSRCTLAHEDTNTCLPAVRGRSPGAEHVPA